MLPIIAMSKPPPQLSPVLYALLVVVLLSSLALVLAKVVRISRLYALTLLLFGSTYLLASIWDIFATGNGFPFTVSVWILFMGVIAGSYVVLYIYFRFGTTEFYRDRVSLIKVLIYIGYIIGIMMVFGVLEDFACFILWGFEYFNPEFAVWHTHWFLGVPTFYIILMIPGLGLLLWTLYLSKRYNVAYKVAQSNKDFKKGTLITFD